MQFHRTSHDPTPGALLICRNARWVGLAIAFGFWCFFGLFAYAPMPVWLMWLLGALCLFITAVGYRDWVIKGRPENWMIALHRDGLWLNLRDVTYHAAPDSDTVLFLPFSEISAVREHVHQYQERSSDGGSIHHKDRYIELLTDSKNTKHISTEILAEQHRKPPMKKYFGGYLRVGTGSIKHQAVTIPEDGVIRVAASKMNFGMQPRLSYVLQRLGEFFPVEKSVKRVDGDTREMDDQAFDVAVAEFAQRGDTIAATRMLIERRGLSMTEAKAQVDALYTATNTDGKGDVS